MTPILATISQLPPRPINLWSEEVHMHGRYPCHGVKGGGTYLRTLRGVRRMGGEEGVNLDLSQTLDLDDDLNSDRNTTSTARHQPPLNLHQPPLCDINVQ